MSGSYTERWPGCILCIILFQNFAVFRRKRKRHQGNAGKMFRIVQPLYHFDTGLNPGMLKAELRNNNFVIENQCFIKYGTIFGNQYGNDASHQS